MDDLIILLVTWLVNSLGGKGKTAPGPTVRPNPQMPARPGVLMNRPAPPTLPSVANRPVLQNPGGGANRGVPQNRVAGPNVRRVVVPANRRPVRRIAGPPPLPAAAGAAAKDAGVLAVVSSAKPAPPPKARAPVSPRSASAGSWLLASVRPGALRRQIIINEILQPPLALREA